MNEILCGVMQSAKTSFIVGILAILLGSCGPKQQSSAASVTSENPLPPEHAGQTSDGGVQSQSPDELSEQATRLMDSHNYDGAIALLTRAIAQQPNDAALYYNRGNAYAAKETHQQALSDYDSAIKLDPSISMYYFNRGNSFRALSRYDQALASYTAAIRIDPLYTKAYVNRAAIYVRMNNEEAALPDLNRAIEIGQFPELEAAYLGRASVYSGMGREDLAQKDIDSLGDLKRGQRR